MRCIVGHNEVGPKFFALHIKYQKGFIASCKSSGIIAMKNMLRLCMIL